MMEATSIRLTHEIVAENWMIELKHGLADRIAATIVASHQFDSIDSNKAVNSNEFENLNNVENEIVRRGIKRRKN